MPSLGPDYLADTLTNHHLSSSADRPSAFTPVKPKHTNNTLDLALGADYTDFALQGELTRYRGKGETTQLEHSAGIITLLTDRLDEQTKVVHVPY